MRYLRLAAVQLRASILLAVQYRLEFVLEAVMALFWTATAVLPLYVLFEHRPAIAGWTWPEALIVVAWFTVLKGVLDGAIRPSLGGVVDHVRKGTLDFILLKPADAQFLVSTTKFEIFAFANVFAGLGILLFALRALGRWPTPGAMLLAMTLLGGAVLLLYAIWIVVIALAFVVVKVDNLSYLFASIYDAARWPASVFRGVVAFVFTFVIPLAVMTTYPALALLGRIDGVHVGLALGGAIAAVIVARVVWLRALARYTSAGG